MTSVTLNCLVVGEDPYEKTLPVDIDINKNIGALKKAIKNDIGESVSARDLKLFRVNIPLGSTRDEDVVAMLKTGDLSVGLEMNNNLQKISVYFSTQPVDTNLHILVQLPTVAIEQPVAVLKGTADSVYLFIDNSNAYIQGKKETARREAVDEHLVQIDYGKLVETAQDSRHMGAVPVVVGSIPPPEDTIWAKLRNLGYSVTVFERNFLNREKEVDSEVSLRISDTIHEYMPGTVILIAGDGDYGPIFRRVLDKNWRIEIWFWTDEMNIDYPEYETAIATRTTIINLDDFYKSFMYACGYNGISGTRWLQIFTDLVEDSDRMECYVELDLFGWWYRPKRDSLKLYVRNYSQWEQLKNLITRKYPNARELNNEVFFLESNTFFKMYYHLKRKVNSVCPKYSD